MNAVDEVWRDLQTSGSSYGSSRPPGKTSLSAFQSTKEKRRKPPHAKQFSLQQAFRITSLTERAPTVHERQEARAETEAGPSVAQGGPVEQAEPHNVFSWHTFASQVHRHANILKEDSSNAKRQRSLSALEGIFMQGNLPRAFYDKAFPFLLEPLLLCLSDPTETARLSAATLLLGFLNEVADVDNYSASVLEALVRRFRSQDIEGVLHLPPVMRPEPEYKPLQLTPMERSEDVRKRLFQMLHTVLDRSSDECMWSHLDEATGLLRAGAMDVCPEIKTVALFTLVEFCDRHKSILLHFTEPLARSLLSCIVYRQAKVRLAALRALTHVLACGLYKYTAEIIQMLAGWRDPNFVPIASLYEVTTTRNYFAELLADHSPMVRMFFFDSLGRWLLRFEDKADYETWLFPYLLSGLFDPFRPIQQLVFSLLERLGKQYEVTHEKDLREIRQLGNLESWSYDGKSSVRFPLGGGWQPADETADETRTREESEQFVSFVKSYSERLRALGFEGCSLTVSAEHKFLTEGGALTGDPPRPCLGARTMVRTYFRRYAKTLFEPVEDFREVTMTTSARLMVISLAYVEDSFVEWLDSCLRMCARSLTLPHLCGAKATEAYKVALRLIGAFIDPVVYWGSVKDKLDFSCAEEMQARAGMLHLLALMLQGSFEMLHQAFDESLGLGRLSTVIPEIAEALARTDLLQEQSISFAAESVTKTVEIIVTGSAKQKAILPTVTWHHLLSVIGALAEPDCEIDDKKSPTISPHIQVLLEQLIACHGPAGEQSGTVMTLSPTCLDVGLSRDLPPSNVAALSSFLRWSRISHILEKETYDVALTKLEEFSAATQAAVTRRRARKTALWLVRILMLVEPSQRETMIGGPHSSTAHACSESFASEANVAESADDGQYSPPETKIEDGEPPKSPTEAAAEILSRVLLSKLRSVNYLGDLKDTLDGLKDLIILLPPMSRTQLQATSDTLVRAGLVEDLCRILKDSRLHTKLFCLAAEEYAHDCAGAYPDRSPAMILEDMPLGKRRELRLSSNKTAAELKQEVILLLRIVLVFVAGHKSTLALLLGSSIASLLPPDRARKQLASDSQKGAEAAAAEGSSPPVQQPAEEVAVNSSGAQGGPITKHQATGIRCQAELPSQAQSPWLLFQTASCLLDTLRRGIVSSSGYSDIKRQAQGVETWDPPLLTMPVAWEQPSASHADREASRSLLLQISSDSDLLEATDSCVRHIVDLERTAAAEESDVCSDGSDQVLWPCANSHGTLKELIDTAKKQINGVPASRQKAQARWALIQVVRLLNEVYPDPVKECLRQYENSGHFRRREVLSQII
ncbi:hypothetical protein ACSSS7_002620 [Eimeria intestinalis]